MSEIVFMPKYVKAGELETLANYSIGNQSFNVYLITIDDDTKFVHDEATRGKLEYITIADAYNSINELDNQINQLKKLREEKERILNELKRYCNKHHLEFHYALIESNKAKRDNSSQATSSDRTCSKETDTNDASKEASASSQTTKEETMHDSKDEAKCQQKGKTVKLLIKTPLGYVKAITDDEIEFTNNLLEAKIFHSKRKVNDAGQKLYEFGSPFLVIEVKVHELIIRDDDDIDVENSIIELLNSFFRLL